MPIGWTLKCMTTVTNHLLRIMSQCLATANRYLDTRKNWQLVDLCSSSEGDIGWIACMAVWDQSLNRFDVNATILTEKHDLWNWRLLPRSAGCILRQGWWHIWFWLFHRFGSRWDERLALSPPLPLGWCIGGREGGTASASTSGSLIFLLNKKPRDFTRG